MARKPTEQDLQRAFCIWLDTPGVLLPDVLYWHTPNGGSRRDAFEGARLKQIGLTPGIPDLFFLQAGALYGMEWKAPGGRLSDAQITIFPRLAAVGLAEPVAVVDDLATARVITFRWGLVTTSLQRPDIG